MTKVDTISPLGASHSTIAPVVDHHDQIAWFEAIPGERLSIRVHGADVNGRYAIMESFAAPGSAAPRHTHAEDEVFYVLEGRPTFALGDEVFEVQPGAVVAIPAGTVHAWKNGTDEQVHMVATFVPGGIEELFTKIAGLAPEQLAALAAEYGTIIVGPPIED
ncbi:MAG: cupin domain-containing protein [Aliihoeflea sp.]|uniref:cupin domain-containing protein n=1 Tax=Aliihoeflea sp. TaxID=2608088 RepID=UPI0040354A13